MSAKVIPVELASVAGQRCHHVSRKLRGKKEKLQLSWPALLAQLQAFGKQSPKALSTYANSMS